MRENIALRQKHKNWRTIFFIEKKNNCGTFIGGPMFVAFVGNPCPCMTLYPHKRIYEHLLNIYYYSKLLINEIASPWTRKKGYPQTLTPTKTTGKEIFLFVFFFVFWGFCLFVFVCFFGGSCYLLWLTVVDMWLREGSNRLRSWSTLGSTDSKLMRSFKRLSTCQI